MRIQLSWDPGVHDLDLHVRGDLEVTSWSVKSTSHSTLREDAFEGGPEIVDLRAMGSVPLHVHVFGGGTLSEARPVVAFVRADGGGFELIRRQDIDASEEWWAVARIGADGVIQPGPQSRVSGMRSPP